jgi:hypothetical protein
MCKVKSAIILKDTVFMPNYDSHTKMLEELGIEDTKSNAKSKFIRAEIYPEDGDAFADISTWKYRVDQDIIPDWYVSEYDEQRMRKSLNEWANTRFGTYVNQKATGDLNIGDAFKIGNIEYIVLDKTDSGVACITVDCINDRKMFDENSNNFNGSCIDRYLNTTYYNWLASQVGADDIINHNVNLVSSDNSKDYGVCERKISLLTVDQYRNYRGIIPRLDKWWWLCTPYSDYFRDVCYVFSDRCVDCGGCGRCRRSRRGVRPFCIFKSSILVSCK